MVVLIIFGVSLLAAGVIAFLVAQRTRHDIHAMIGAETLPIDSLEDLAPHRRRHRHRRPRRVPPGLRDGGGGPTGACWVLVHPDGIHLDGAEKAISRLRPQAGLLAFGGLGAAVLGITLLITAAFV